MVEFAHAVDLLLNVFHQIRLFGELFLIDALHRVDFVLS
jgi:hypothetical protein